MLRKLLAGKTQRAQRRLDELFEYLGDDIKISWYPSAGNDFRDILEFHPIRRRQYGIEDEPNLLIHTDYAARWMGFRYDEPDFHYYTNHRPNLCKTVYADTRTKVIIEDKCELRLKKPVNYFVKPEYAAFADDAPSSPKIYLLDVRLISTILGEIRKPVIYFLFENINFLDEIIFKYNIKIPFIVKVREGCGLGGNLESIMVSYAFLSKLETKYLITDTHSYPDFKIIAQLKKKHQLQPLDYEILHLNYIRSWSELWVNIFSVIYKDTPLTKKRFKVILEEIRSIREE